MHREIPDKNSSAETGLAERVWRIEQSPRYQLDYTGDRKQTSDGGARTITRDAQLHGRKNMRVADPETLIHSECQGCSG